MTTWRWSTFAIWNVQLKLRGGLYISKCSMEPLHLTTFCSRLEGDSPNCSFCEKLPETSLHIFCDCECVKSILSDLHSFIISKLKDNIQIGNFEIMFGCPNNKFLTYVFLCTKFYFYKCKFQNQTPSFTGLKLFFRNQHDVEYRIATRKQT